LSIGTGHTAPAGIQKSLSRFWSWRRGGNEVRSTRPKNELKLSEIIMEINDLREFAFGPDSTKRDRWRCSSLTICR
jgi:hypothetical protein